MYLADPFIHVLTGSLSKLQQVCEAGLAFTVALLTFSKRLCCSTPSVTLFFTAHSATAQAFPSQPFLTNCCIFTQLPFLKLNIHKLHLFRLLSLTRVLKLCCDHYYKWALPLIPLEPSLMHHSRPHPE